jgi:hypothetical protein
VSKDVAIFVAERDPPAKMFVKHWAKRFGVAFSERVRDFGLFQNVQVDTGAHTASYSMGTGRPFLGSEAAEA